MSIFYGELLSANDISTNIRVDSNNVITNVRAHIYRDGFLTSGEVQLSIYEGATLLNSTEIDYTLINDITTDTYAHGWLRFDIPTPLKWNFDTDYSEYTIKIQYKNSSVGDKIWLVSDLNNPIVPLHTSDSIYVRGFEIFVGREF